MINIKPCYLLQLEIKLKIFKKNTTINFTYFLIAIIIIGLLNELTLAIFDKNPPLAPLILTTIRIFDIIILLSGLFSVFYDVSFFTNVIKNAQTGFTSKFSKVFTLIFYYLMILIILDIGIGFAGFGYQRNLTKNIFIEFLLLMIILMVSLMF